MSLGPFLAGRPPRPNPAAPRWRIERLPTEGSGSPVRVREAEGLPETVVTEVAHPAPGEFAPGDLVTLHRVWPEETSLWMSWFVPEDGVPVPLPPAGALGQLHHRARSILSGDAGWDRAWAVADGEVLLDLMDAAGVDPARLVRLGAALLRAAFGRFGRSGPGEGPFDRSVSLLERAPLDPEAHADVQRLGNHMVARLDAGDPSLAGGVPGGLWRALVRVVDLATGAPDAQWLDLILGGLAEGAPGETARAWKAERLALIRAHVPLRALLEAAAEQAR